MHTTNIIRRIDDLGRIAIPKEIRRSLRIWEGEPMEIFTDKDKVIFRKYSDIKSRCVEIAQLCCKSWSPAYLHFLVICDNSTIIAGPDKYVNLPISAELSDLIRDRKTSFDFSRVRLCNLSRVRLCNNFEDTISAVSPILYVGELYGAVLLVNKNFNKEINKSELGAMSMINNIITKSLEN